jgi:hypothetical protein
MYPRINYWAPCPIRTHQFRPILSQTMLIICPSFRRGIRASSTYSGYHSTPHSAGPVEIHAFSKGNWRQTLCRYLNQSNLVHLKYYCTYFSAYTSWHYTLNVTEITRPAIVKKDFVQLLLTVKSVPELRSIQFLHPCSQITLLRTY